MKNQRDNGQKFSKQLRTITENSSSEGLFAELTYFVRYLRSSTLRLFIAPKDGRRNGIDYKQGHLVLTKSSNSGVTVSIENGHLFITSPPEETYSLDERGHLICVTIQKV